MPLVMTLASRNLFHDQLRFIATLVGIVFSVVLVLIQMGLFLGFGRMVTTMIDHANADLWVLPKGAKCFEDPSLLDLKLRDKVTSVDGVASVLPMVIGFSDWRLDSGEMTPVFIVGADLKAGILQPWNVVEGDGRACLQVAKQHAHCVAILSSRHGDQNPVPRFDEAMLAHGAAHIPE